MSFQSTIDSIRLILYMVLTLVLLAVSFFPEGYLFYLYVVEQHSVLDFLLAPLYMFFTYCVTVIFFGVVHSQFVLRLTLPYRVKPGKYSHHSPEGRLIAMRLSADGIFKSMLQVFTFLPFIWGIFLFPYGMRLYGLKCGKNVYIATKTWIDTAGTVEIGDNTFVGWNAAISGHENKDRSTIIDPVRIGKNCTIGAYCIIGPGVELPDRTVLGAMSGFPKSTKVEKPGVYVGIPAKLIEEFKPK